MYSRKDIIKEFNITFNGLKRIEKVLCLHDPNNRKNKKYSYEDYLRKDTKSPFWLVNTNKLVRLYDGADGLKTGHTDNAGYCLAATAKRNGMRLIAIVLGENTAKIRNSETTGLLDYGFNNKKVQNIKKSDDVIKKVTLDKASIKIFAEA